MRRLARRFKRERAEDGEELLKIPTILLVYDVRELPLRVIGCMPFFREGLDGVTGRNFNLRRGGVWPVGLVSVRISRRNRVDCAG